MGTLFGCRGLFGGVDTVLEFLFKGFGGKLPNRGEEKVVHVVEDVTVGCVIAGGIEVGEEGLKFFEKQGFGVVAGSDGGHGTSLSRVLHHYNKSPTNFYAPIDNRPFSSFPSNKFKEFTYRINTAWFFIIFIFYTEVKMSVSPIQLLAQSLRKVHDPRSSHGISHGFHSTLLITLLGLLANLSTIAQIERWAKLHFSELKQFIYFRAKKAPSDNTISRILQKISLDELQSAFAEFLNAILPNDISVAAVDGKTAKQMKEENGDAILMLNVFAQKIKQHLVSWSVRGDKTNEPGCLKQHLEELFTMYPSLKLLTGDAIYAQRPLLEAIQKYHRDYLVQVKENQSNVLEQMKLVFEEAPQQKPDDHKVSKKRAASRFAVCG